MKNRKLNELFSNWPAIVIFLAGCAGAYAAMISSNKSDADAKALQAAQEENLELSKTNVEVSKENVRLV